MEIWDKKRLIKELNEFNSCSLDIKVLKYMATPEFMLLSSLKSFDFQTWRQEIFYKGTKITFASDEASFVIDTPELSRLIIKVDLQTNEDIWNRKAHQYLFVSLLDMGIEFPMNLYLGRYSYEEIYEVKKYIHYAMKEASKVKKCQKCFGLLQQKDTRNEKDKYWECDRPQCDYREGDLTPLNSPFREEPTKDDEVCPQCGARMKLREAKQGKNKGKKFWGCSAFPACKTTRPYNYITKGWGAVDSHNYI